MIISSCDCNLCMCSRWSFSLITEVPFKGQLKFYHTRKTTPCKKLYNNCDWWKKNTSNWGERLNIFFSMINIFHHQWPGVWGRVRWDDQRSCGAPQEVWLRLVAGQQTPSSPSSSTSSSSSSSSWSMIASLIGLNIREARRTSSRRSTRTATVPSLSTSGSALLIRTTRCRDHWWQGWLWQRWRWQLGWLMVIFNLTSGSGKQERPGTRCFHAPRSLMFCTMVHFPFTNVISHKTMLRARHCQLRLTSRTRTPSSPTARRFSFVAFIVIVDINISFFTSIVIFNIFIVQGTK